MRSYEELKSTMERKGYAFFTNSINLIGERTDDVFDNRFSDYLHIAYRDHLTGKRLVLTIPWTTLAGTLGKGGVLDPLTVGGMNVATGRWETITGVAVLKEGQYRRAYEFIDSYVGWLRYPYFQQVAPVDIHRDGNKDQIFDRNSVVHRGLFGINLHRMSNNGVNSDIVNLRGISWSQGCQGAIEPEFRKILPIIREDVKRFGKLFTYTLLHSKDFA